MYCEEEMDKIVFIPLTFNCELLKPLFLDSISPPLPIDRFIRMHGEQSWHFLGNTKSGCCSRALVLIPNSRRWVASPAYSTKLCQQRSYSHMEANQTK